MQMKMSRKKYPQHIFFALPESWAAAAYCDIWEEKDLGRLESAACRSAAWAAVRFLRVNIIIIIVDIMTIMIMTTLQDG